MIPPPPPPAPGSAWNSPGERSRSTLPEQVVWTIAGLAGLFGFVGAAHASGVAFDCTLYGIYDASGTAGACPVLSWPTLVLLAGFAVPSSMIAIGLSRDLIVRLSPFGARPDPRRATRGSGLLALEFMAPFLMFFGWGVLAWGLTEPVLDNCIEPCGYPTLPYVLGGTAWQLSIIGGSALAVGGGLLLRVWRAQRATRPARA